jgi:hypothetical protein
MRRASDRPVRRRRLERRMRRAAWMRRRRTAGMSGRRTFVVVVLLGGGHGRQHKCKYRGNGERTAHGVPLRFRSFREDSREA